MTRNILAEDPREVNRLSLTEQAFDNLKRAIDAGEYTHLCSPEPITPEQHAATNRTRNLCEIFRLQEYVSTFPSGCGAEKAKNETALDIALGYIGRGWNPVPIPFREKGPRGKEWQKRIIDASNAEQFFNCGEQNIGILLGPSSNGLCDIDLDCPEALLIAPYLLPKSSAVFDRTSKRFSHTLYYSADCAELVGKAAAQFKDPNKFDNDAMLLELRVGAGGKAAQTVFPGSIHTSGEEINWEQGYAGEPLRIDGAVLLRAGGIAAAACLFARYWPSIGARHDAALCLGGFLARGGMPARDAELFAEAVAKAAGADRDGVADTIRCVRDAVNDYAKGTETIYGFPATVEKFGEKTARKCAEWLGFECRDGDGDEREPETRHSSFLP
jgi:hypothetical protein